MRLVYLLLLLCCSLTSGFAQFKLVPFEYEIQEYIFNQPDFDRAEQLIDSSANKYGTEIGHEVLRIYLIDAKGNIDEATSKAKMLLEQNPNSIRALLAYGDLVIDKYEDYILADSLYARAETLCNSTDNFALYFIHMAQAFSFFDQYQYSKAITLLKEILRTYPNAPRTNGLLGAIHIRQLNLDLGLKYSQKANKYSDLAYIDLNIAIAYSFQGKYKKSIKMLDKLYLACPDNEYTLTTLGYAYTQIGETDKGLAMMNKSIEIAPENPYPYRNLGVFYINQNDTKKACMFFEKALNLNYTNAFNTEVLDLQQKHCK